MARRRVTYLEVAGERPVGAGAGRLVVDLGPRGPQRAEAARAAPRRERPACPAWLAHVALVALVACGALLAHVTTGPDEQRAADRARERREPRLSEPDAQPAAARSGPIVVPTSSIVAEP